MSLYPLPITLCVRRGYACTWRNDIKQRTDVGFVEADEGREDVAMAGKSVDSTKVRWEGESQMNIPLLSQARALL